MMRDVPQVSLAGGATRQTDPLAGNRPTTLVSAGANVAYEVDLFGRLARASDAASLDEQNPHQHQQREKEDVRDSLRMSAEDHQRPCERREDESTIRDALREQIEREHRSGQKARCAHDRKMQPDAEECGKAECDRAGDAREERPAPAAIEERARHRDQQLHRGFGGE